MNLHMETLRAAGAAPGKQMLVFAATTYRPFALLICSLILPCLPSPFPTDNCTLVTDLSWMPANNPQPAYKHTLFFFFNLLALWIVNDNPHYQGQEETQRYFGCS